MTPVTRTPSCTTPEGATQHASRPRRRKSSILAHRGSSGASSRAPDPPYSPREGCSTHPGATTGVTPAQGVWPHWSCPQRSTTSRWDSRSRRGRTGVTSSTSEAALRPPERGLSAPSGATTGVILAHSAATPRSPWEHYG